MDLSMATCNAERAAMKSSEYRKVIKPLLERRRRARINNCLDELKALILETAQPENTDASKLEKADILELTVQHLKNLRHGVMPSISTRRTVNRSPLVDDQVGGPDKYRAGFAECAHEVSAFISALSGVESEVKSRLVSHLAHCVNRIVVQPTASTRQMVTSSSPPHHHHHQQQQQQQQQYETTHVPFSRITVTTPTPPPSPQCGTPTTMTSSQTEYVVPVSPISPPIEPYQQYHQYDDRGQYRSYDARCDTYVYSDVRSVSRSSSVDTPSSSSYEGYFSDRAESPVSPMSFQTHVYSQCKQVNTHLPTTTMKTEEKPWRPW